MSRFLNRRVQPRTLGLRLSRRVALLSLIAVAGLVAAGLVALQSAVQSVQSRLHEAALVATGEFDTFLADVESALRATGDTMAAGTSNPDEVFRRVLVRNPAVFEVALIDPDGEVQTYRRRVGAAPPVLGEQPWLATVRGGRTYIGSVELEEYGVPFLDMAVPVFDADGAFYATLVAKLDLTALWGTVVALRAGETGYVYVTDEDGRVIAYRDLEVVESEDVLVDIVGYTPQQLSEAGFVPYMGISSVQVIGRGVQLNRVPWFVIVEQPITEALRPVAVLVVIVVGGLLLAGVLVQSIVRFTQSEIVSPLFTLREHVEVLGGGDLSRRVEIAGHEGDEIGVLSTTLNQMAGQLESNIVELQQSEQRFRTLVEHAPEAILVYDFDTDRFVDVNENALRLLGYEQEALLKLSPTDISPSPSLGERAGAGSVIGKFQQALSGQAPIFEQACRRADGEEVPVEMRLVRLPAAGRSLVRASMTDITERKRIEEARERYTEELKRATALAREASRLKSEFLATMSHELRTPLNAIIGFTEIMLAGMGGALDEDALHMSRRIHANSQRLLGLINDVLDLARIEARRLEIISQPFSPRKLVEELHDEMTSLAETKGLEFRVEIGEGVPATMVGDPALIQRVISNLLSNALKFTERGHVTLSVDVAEGKRWTINVADTGIGIPPHALEYIFDPFRQVDGTSQRAYSGSGLGLAIAQELVRALQGTIRVTSAVGKGTTFTVTLPVVTEEDSVEAKETTLA